MPKIKHIAIATQDPDKTAKFYIDVFGMREIAKLDSPNAKGYYLSDGNINLAILDFQNDQVAGAEYGQNYSGIHHIGFQVDDLEVASRSLEAAQGKLLTARERVGTPREATGRAESKWAGPDSVVIDISEPGWSV